MTRNIITTADKPRYVPAEAVDIEALSALLPPDTNGCPQLALDYQAAIGRVGALQAEREILAAENHATRNEMQVWQLKVHALQAALTDLLTAINAIPYHWIVADYLKRIEPQMTRAGEVLAAVEITVELDKEQK